MAAVGPIEVMSSSSASRASSVNRGIYVTPREQNFQCAYWISSKHTQRVPLVLQYYKEVLQYCTTENCSTDTHLLLLCCIRCITSAPWTRKMPSRSPYPKRPKREAEGWELAGRCCLTAGATTDHSPDASRLWHPDR
jgi:hypothetical protein